MYKMCGWKKRMTPCESTRGFSPFLQHRRSKEKKILRLTFGDKSSWNAPSRLPKPNPRVREWFFARDPTATLCVCFCTVRLILATAWSKFLHTHARTRKPLSPSRILKPCRPAGKRQWCVICLSRWCLRRVRWLILAPLPNHRPILAYKTALACGTKFIHTRVERELESLPTT